MYHAKKKRNLVLISSFLLLSFSLIFAVLLLVLLSSSEQLLFYDNIYELVFHIIQPVFAIPNIPTSNDTLTSSPIINHPPVANAGKNQTVNENATITLNGIATDPDANDNDNLNYLWKQTAGPAIILNDSNTENPIFIAPPVTIAVDSSGNVYVGDQSHTIKKFDSEGSFITEWGSVGDSNGQFNVIRGIAIGSKNCTVSDNIIQTICNVAQRYPGIRFDASNTRISSNVISNTMGEGILLVGSPNDSIISGNTILNSGLGGITSSGLLNSSNLIITGNIVKSTANRSPGIHNRGATNTVITENVVEKASGSGIVVTELSHFVVSNNIVTDSSVGNLNVYSGIYAAPTDDGIIAGNESYNTGDK